MRGLTLFVLIASGCAGTYHAIGDPMLKRQVSYETGCPEDKIIPGQWNNNPEGVDAEVCGQHRRYEWNRPTGRFIDVTPH